MPGPVLPKSKVRGLDAKAVGCGTKTSPPLFCLWAEGSVTGGNPENNPPLFCLWAEGSVTGGSDDRTRLDSGLEREVMVPSGECDLDRLSCCCRSLSLLWR
jgi:hypothetical protein